MPKLIGMRQVWTMAWARHERLSSYGTDLTEGKRRLEMQFERRELDKLRTRSGYCEPNR